MNTNTFPPFLIGETATSTNAYRALNFNDLEKAVGYASELATAEERTLYVLKRIGDSFAVIVAALPEIRVRVRETLEVLGVYSNVKDALPVAIAHVAKNPGQTVDVGWSTRVSRLDYRWTNTYHPATYLASVDNGERIDHYFKLDNRFDATVIVNGRGKPYTLETLKGTFSGNHLDELITEFDEAPDHPLS